MGLTSTIPSGAPNVSLLPLTSSVRYPLSSLSVRTPRCVSVSVEIDVASALVFVYPSLLSADQMVPLDPIIFFVIQIIIK